MKFTHSIYKIKPQDRLLVAFDVSKDKLNFYLVYGTENMLKAQGEIKNRTIDIEKCLTDLKNLALQHQYPALHVLCEPTGAYEKNLLRTARRMGCTTSYVSGEKVHKFKVVENNDTGKSDIKDPRVILLLGELGKDSVCRYLQQEYVLLRRLNQLFDKEMTDRVQVRCRIHRLLIDLFCDYSFKKDFFYSPSGQALMKAYGFSPYRIVKAGYKRFKSKMRKLAPRIRHSTIDRLWHDAQSSVLHHLNEDLLNIMETELTYLNEEYHLKTNRLEQVRVRMTHLYTQLLARGEPVPRARKGFATAFQIARILGETGPLSDFRNARELLKYAGMNLIQRQSGKYRGKEKISKKGRARLRHVVNQAVLPLLKRSALYGPYYHTRKEMNKYSSKLTMALMRKFLTMFFALGTKGVEFNAERVFTCESKYVHKAA